ncbi:MAG: PilZ domain-containing protein [Candidatus Omnitrophica bacterium]|nr:PilZ domain-containing protein [Candidatus Omnitrophota bacterium]
MLGKKETLSAERRKYVRLDSVFPVQFRLLGLDASTLMSDWIQGFTSDISKGGICLEVNNLKEEQAVLLRAHKVKISLEIEMPIARHPVKAVAKIAWIKDIPGQLNRYLIGLSYENINPSENSRIMRYALTKKFFAPTALILIVLLGLAFGFNAYFNFRLIQGNKALVSKLVSVLQDSRAAREKISQISRDKDNLQSEIQSLQQHIQILDREKEKATKEKEKVTKEEASKINELNSFIQKLTQDKSTLQERLTNLERKEEAASVELQDLEKKKVTLEKENFDKMYGWLKIHQNPRTGLVMSFEGDGDLPNWAFIYDQSLVIQLFTYLSDFERAKKIIDFFDRKAKRVNGAFLNAYYANDGLPAEFIIHSGPNIWLGIAIAQYTQRTQDRSYLKLAEEIARYIINLENEDQDGGIRGGPQVSWYSTEHNLDAYAFFNMLYKMTNKEEYARARDKVLNWLVTHTYDKADIPVKRGKGDSTIATDTYAWSIAAIGPEKLEKIGMDPDRIMSFAQQNCSAEVSYVRPDGQTVKIRGFDFAAQKNIARGAVVSSEWTAQMVISFRIMADFYRKKGMPARAKAYQEKAQEYLANLVNMIISSPSPSGQGESCLPYATQDFADTGHGWMTPKGSSTGSVAGTAYTLFAYYGYNPFELQE